MAATSQILNRQSVPRPQQQQQKQQQKIGKFNPLQDRRPDKLLTATGVVGFGRDDDHGGEI